MVYPSKFEGFGLPPLESMALGTPVITTPFSSIKEVCKDCALYFNPDENNSLYNTIIEFEKSNMKEKLIQMGLNNARNFSWEKSAKKYIEIIILKYQLARVPQPPIYNWKILLDREEGLVVVIINVGWYFLFF